MIQKEINKPSPTPIVIAFIFVILLFVGIYITIFAFSTDGDTPKTSNTSTEAGISEYSSLTKSEYVFLIGGKDSVSGLTDVLLLVALNVEECRLNIVQIPRDTYLRYTDRGQKKINAASHTLGGLDCLADILEQSFNITIDHTVEFTLNTFARMIDMIDGVVVNVPFDMDYDDPSQNLHIHLKAGNNLLHGDQSVQFVRYRSGYIQGDIARMDAQKVFLSALAQKLINDISPMKIPALVGAIMCDVSTSLKLHECIDFANIASKISTENITMATMPGCDVRENGNSGLWYYIINRKSASEIICKYFCALETGTFDSARLFTSSANKNFENIYDSDNYSIIEYRADDIIKNGINIDYAEPSN